MDKTELTRLKELAEKADASAWDGHFNPDTAISVINLWSACNPQTILAMIAEIERLREYAGRNLRKILQHFAKSYGYRVPRFDDPDYMPEDAEIDEKLYLYDEGVKFHKHICKAYNQLDKEADWLARRLAEFCDPDHDRQCCVLCRGNCDGVDYKEWREAAHKVMRMIVDKEDKK